MVALDLRSRPTRPAKAARTSGRPAWFSMRGRSSGATSESPSTRPSAEITVTRAPVGRADWRTNARSSAGDAPRATSARVASCRSRALLARRASSISTANASRARVR